jgi:hypothetical protein
VACSRLPKKLKIVHIEYVNDAYVFLIIVVAR